MAATAPPAPGWIDNHCHLDGEDDPAALVDDARSAGVTDLVTVGTSVERSAACLRLASTLDGVWCTAGVHPHEARRGCGGLRDLLEAGVAGGRLVAVGECGLDFHYDHSPRSEQAAVFAEQVALAHELDLPLVIHTREAWEETFAILDTEGVPARTVFHCFTGGPDEARAALDRGAHLSVSGIVTFPGADELRAAVAAAPLDRLLVETDAPYLAPVPHRGRRNRPAWVAVVGAAVAALVGREAGEVARVTSANARAVYGLDERASAGR